jgi:hypothetical protein
MAALGASIGPLLTRSSDTSEKLSASDRERRRSARVRARRAAIHSTNSAGARPTTAKNASPPATLSQVSAIMPIT